MWLVNGFVLETKTQIKGLLNSKLGSDMVNVYCIADQYNYVKALLGGQAIINPWPYFSLSTVNESEY